MVAKNAAREVDPALRLAVVWGGVDEESGIIRHERLSNRGPGNTIDFLARTPLDGFERGCVRVARTGLANRCPQRRRRPGPREQLGGRKAQCAPVQTMRRRSFHRGAWLFGEIQQEPILGPVNDHVADLKIPVGAVRPERPGSSYRDRGGHPPQRGAGRVQCRLSAGFRSFHDVQDLPPRQHIFGNTGVSAWLSPQDLTCRHAECRAVTLEAFVEGPLLRRCCRRKQRQRCHQDRAPWQPRDFTSSHRIHRGPPVAAFGKMNALAVGVPSTRHSRPNVVRRPPECKRNPAGATSRRAAKPLLRPVPHGVARDPLQTGRGSPPHMAHCDLFIY